MSKRSTTFFFIVILSGLMVSCGSDPWAGSAQTPDIVTITKTTKFTGIKNNYIKGKVKDTEITKSPLIKAAVGPVKMSHLIHTDNGMKCIDCHHKENNDARIKKCAVCHRGNDGFEKLHHLCLDCHIRKRNGVTKCMHCH